MSENLLTYNNLDWQTPNGEFIYIYMYNSRIIQTQQFPD